MKTSSNPHTRVKKSSRADYQGRESKLLANICIILLILSPLLPGAVLAGIIGSETELSTEEIEPLQYVWNIEDVYTNGMGRICEYTSIALDSLERPHIAFDDTSDLADPYNLMYASRLGSTWFVEYADTNGKVGLYASLDIDDKNRPHISHHDGPNRDLKYTKKESGVWSTETVDSAGSVGWFTSIVLDSKDNPHISYYDAANAMVKYTTNNGSGWNNTDAFQLPWLPHTSLALDPAEIPHISALGVHAEKNGSSWDTEAIYPPSWPDLTWQPQPIAIGSDGTIHIALKGFDKLPFYYKVKKPGGPWQMEVVDPKAATGSSPSIALDSNGNPHISYRDTDGPLMHAVKIGGVWIREVADPTTISTAWTSIVIDSNDNLHISYYDDFNGILKYVKGTPYPDLVLSNVVINPPSPVSHGTNISFNSTILNTGVIDAVNVTVNIRDSLSIIAESVIPLIEAAIGIAWFNVTWFASPPYPNQIPHDICIFVDPYDNITEYSESNNKLCSPIIVLGAPDLKLADDDISLSPGGPVSKDTVITINATIYNLGEENASNVVVRFYDGVPTPGNQIGGDQLIAFIECFIGVGYAEMQWIATPLGRHDIHVMADPENVITEIFETNNVGAGVVNVIGADYIPWNTPVSPQKISIGNSIPISSQIKNVGATNATVDSIIAFYNQSAPLTPFKTDIVAPLNVGVVSPEYNATWTAPSITGIYHVVIEVDYFNDVEEFSEANNTYEIEFNVTDKPITTINLGAPQYGTTPRYVNSLTQFWFSVVDNSGTGYSTYYCIDGPPWIQYSGAFTVASEGPHTINYYTIDNIGGIEDAKAFEIIVDNTPPVTFINTGDPKHVSGNTWVTSATEFTIFVSDAGLMPVGVNHTEYRIWNGGSWTPLSTYTTSFSLGSSEGFSYVELYSIDWLGNKEPINNRTYIVDNTAPTTTIQVGSPKYITVDTWVTSNTLFTLEGTDGGLIPTGVDHTEYRIWNGTWSGWRTFNNGFTLDGDDGLRYVEFYSVDWLGNEEPKQYKIYVVDNTSPKTSIVVDEPKYVSGNIWVTSNTLFTLEANDIGSFSVGLDYVKYRVWSNGLWSGWQEYKDGFMLNMNSGLAFIEFYSADCLGNNEFKHNATYYVDNLSPSTDFGIQFNSDNTGALISLIADDAGSGVSYTKYRIGDGPWITYSNTFLINEPGAHLVFFQSTDNVGNVEDEKNFPLYVFESTNGPTPQGEEETNYKPLIALMFTIILLLFGTYVSYKRPLKILNGKKLHTWLLLVLPIVVIEALTGVISISTGNFGVPPFLGPGMAVDLAILILGLLVYVLIYKRFGKN